MTLTNELNLPQALVDACDVTPHNAPNTVSATTLKSGVREILLTKRHWDELKDDVSNRIWALFGTAVHALLEKESPDTFVEERFSKKVSEYLVTGRLDCYDMKNGIIVDYKTASVWKYKFGDYSDWRFQGLVYAWLLKQQGLEVKECQFIMMFKDFSKSKAKVEVDYPKRAVEVYKFSVTDSDLAGIERKIFSKVKELEDNELVADDNLPVCTEEERWARPSTWAVMKRGRKSAVKLFKTEEDADLMLKNCDESYYKLERFGESVKCNGYCLCSEFCSFAKRLKTEPCSYE